MQDVGFEYLGVTLFEESCLNRLGLLKCVEKF